MWQERRPTDPDERRLVDDLRAALEPLPKITMAWLFGSAARGRMTGESDVDVAVRFQGGRHELNDIMEVWHALSRVVNREVDVVPLDGANPSLAWSAVREGIPLIIRDEKAALEYTLQLSREAEDWEAFIEDLYRLRRLGRRGVQ